MTNQQQALLKKVLRWSLGILIGFLVIPLVLPSAYQVERSINIDARREQIFLKIVDLRTWQKWSSMSKMEPSAKFAFEGTPGVVGSRLSWEGNKIGMGKSTLVKVVQPEYIETKVVFHETAEATGYWKLVKNEQGTEVIRGIKGDLSYPLGRYLGLAFNNLLGDQYEDGLVSLKKLIENKN